MIRQRPRWQTQALCKEGASEGGVFRKVNALCTLCYAPRERRGVSLSRWFVNDGRYASRAQEGWSTPLQDPFRYQADGGGRAVYKMPGLGLLGAHSAGSLVNQGQQRVSLWNKSLLKHGTNSKGKGIICPQVGVIFPLNWKGLISWKTRK